MFLTEIEKDEVAYGEKCKNKVKKYLINFFGEKYAKQIERRLIDTPLIFIDRKGIGYYLKMENATKELTEEYADYLLMSFPQTLNKTFNVNDVCQKTFSIMQKLYYYNNTESEKKAIEKELKFFIQDDEFSLLDDDIKFCKYLLPKYLENILKLEENCAKIECEKFIVPKKLRTEEDAKQYKSVAKIFDQLTKIKKEYLISRINFFIDSETTTGFMLTPSFFDKKQNKHEKFKFICFDALSTVQQKTFIHELIHAISFKANFIQYKGENCSFAKHGININMAIENDKECIRESVILNEVLTDFFAILIKNQMLENGDKILIDNKHNTSTYSYCFVLFSPFFKKHLDLLKECYICNDADMFEKSFGFENAKALSDLAENFMGYSQFMAQRNYGLAHSFENGLRSAELLTEQCEPLAYKYFSCFKQMKKIMEDVDEFMKNNKNELVL
ncbi:MAG: hypothetical protein ACI4TI_02875 [Christensenellales bacterium]